MRCRSAPTQTARRLARIVARAGPAIKRRAGKQRLVDLLRDEVDLHMLFGVSELEAKEADAADTALDRLLP